MNVYNFTRKANAMLMGKLFFTNKKNGIHTSPNTSPQYRTIPLLQVICHFFFWPVMKQNVQNFVCECLKCQRFKIEQKNSVGQLWPFDIKLMKWEYISYDKWY